MMKARRIPCEVLGCRRTAPADKHEPGARIVCGKCWRLGSKVHRDAYRLATRALLTCEAGTAEARLHRGDLNRAWRAVVAEASEARAGIG